MRSVRDGGCAGAGRRDCIGGGDTAASAASDTLAALWPIRAAAVRRPRVGRLVRRGAGAAGAAARRDGTDADDAGDGALSAGLGGVPADPGRAPARTPDPLARRADVPAAGAAWHLALLPDAIYRCAPHQRGDRGGDGDRVDATRDDGGL